VAWDPFAIAMDVATTAQAIDVLVPRSFLMPENGTIMGLFLADGLTGLQSSYLNPGGQLLEGRSLFCTADAVFWQCVHDVPEEPSAPSRERIGSTNATHRLVSLPQPEWRGTYILKLVSSDCVEATSSAPFQAGLEHADHLPRIEAMDAGLAGDTNTLLEHVHCQELAQQNESRPTNCPQFTVRVHGRGSAAHVNDSIALLPVGADSVSGAWRRQLLSFLRATPHQECVLGSTQPEASVLLPIPTKRTTYVAVLISGARPAETTAASDEEHYSRILTVSDVFVSGLLWSLSSARSDHSPLPPNYSYRVQQSLGLGDSVDITAFAPNVSTARHELRTSATGTGGNITDTWIRIGLSRFEWFYQFAALATYADSQEDAVVMAQATSRLLSPDAYLSTSAIGIAFMALHSVLNSANRAGLVTDEERLAQITEWTSSHLTNIGSIRLADPAAFLPAPYWQMVTATVPVTDLGRQLSVLGMAWRRVTLHPSGELTYIIDGVYLSPSFLVRPSAAMCVMPQPSPPPSPASPPLPAATQILLVTLAVLLVVAFAAFVRRWQQRSTYTMSSELHVFKHHDTESPDLTPSGTTTHAVATTSIATVSAAATTTTTLDEPPVPPVCGLLAAETLEVEWTAKLGAGGFGSVYMGRWHGSVVAVKVLPKQCDASADMAKMLRAEVGALADQRHPCICSFFGTAVLSCGSHAIVLEYLNGGTLHTLLHVGQASERTAPALSTPLACRLARETASGVSFLHASGYMHRDVKSSNILLDARDDGYHAKVADFGVATLRSTAKSSGGAPASSPPTSEDDGSNDPTGGASSQHTTCCGTLRYMAPEMTRGTRYDCACDVYSFGIVLWEVMHEQRPFAYLPHDGGVAIKVLNGERPTVNLPPERARFGELMTQCWAHIPAQRPLMEDTFRQLKSLEDDLGHV